MCQAREAKLAAQNSERTILTLIRHLSDIGPTLGELELALQEARHDLQQWRRGAEANSYRRDGGERRCRTPERARDGVEERRTPEWYADRRRR